MLHEFSYLAPGTRAELFKLLEARGAAARILAGGTDLLVDIRAGKARPDCVVDIKQIPEYRAIAYSPRAGLSVGATVTCIDLLEDATVRAKYPLIREAAGRIGSPQLRNRATVAGNFCTASPCADLGTCLLALGASVELASAAGTRMVPLKEFFTGVKRTQLKPGEVLERVWVPADMAGARGGMEKLKRIKGHDLALVSVVMAARGKLLRVAVGSAAPTPVVTADLDSAAPVKAVVAAVMAAIKPISDVRAGREFREFMIQHYVEQLHHKVRG